VREFNNNQRIVSSTISSTSLPQEMPSLLVSLQITEKKCCYKSHQFALIKIKHLTTNYVQSLDKTLGGRCQFVKRALT